MFKKVTQITIRYNDDTIAEYNEPHYIKVTSKMIIVKSLDRHSTTIYFTSEIIGVWYKDC